MYFGVISESILLVVGRAIRCLLRTGSIILQHLFQIIASVKFFIEAIGSANASSLIVAPESLNGNVG